MRPHGRHPVWLPPGSPPVFPDPREYDDHGLLAGGGDLAATRLLTAYSQGIFPWFDEEPILWWSPSPRAILQCGEVHVSRSMRRVLRDQSLRVSTNEDLRGVMDGCADERGGTWLTEEMKLAYEALGRLGHVRSYEVWAGDALVGGLYGVQIGALFAAESMFHRKTNASKVALISAATHVFAAGAQVFDVQFKTEHLESMGVVEIDRERYLEQVEAAIGAPLRWPREADPASLLPWVSKIACS